MQLQHFSLIFLIMVLHWREKHVIMNYYYYKLLLYIYQLLYLFINYYIYELLL